jgi:hypothetical protein
MEQNQFIVAIKYNDHSNHFFIDFSNDEHYIISIKVTEGVARSIAAALGLKIMIG